MRHDHAQSRCTQKLDVTICEYDQQGDNRRRLLTALGHANCSWLVFENTFLRFSDFRKRIRTPPVGEVMMYDI